VLEFFLQSIGLLDVKHTGVGTSSPWLMGQRPSLAGVAVALLGWTALGLSGDAAAGSAVRSLRSSDGTAKERGGVDMDRLTCTNGMQPINTCLCCIWYCRRHDVPRRPICVVA